MYLVLYVNDVNRWSRKRITALALLFTAIATVTMSVAYFTLWKSEDSTRKFLFLELRTIIEAHVLQGKWGRLIDFPHYRYDVSTGRIEYSENPFDLDRLIAVYGSLVAYRPAAGTPSDLPIGGASSYLYPIYSTPFLDPLDRSLTISNIDSDGTAHTIYESKEIVLSLKQQWRTENETLESSERAVVKLIHTTTIENLGFWKKTNISSTIRGSFPTTSLASPVIVEDRSKQRDERLCGRVWKNSYQKLSHHIVLSN